MALHSTSVPNLAEDGNLDMTSYAHLPRGGILPSMGYIGVCGPKGYGFSAVSVINRVSSLADFGRFGHK